MQKMHKVLRNASKMTILPKNVFFLLFFVFLPLSSKMLVWCAHPVKAEPGKCKGECGWGRRKVSALSENGLGLSLSQCTSCLLVHKVSGSSLSQCTGCILILYYRPGSSLSQCTSCILEHDVSGSSPFQCTACLLLYYCPGLSPSCPLAMSRPAQAHKQKTVSGRRGRLIIYPTATHQPFRGGLGSPHDYLSFQGMFKKTPLNFFFL